MKQSQFCEMNHVVINGTISGHATQKVSQIEMFPLEELISKVDDAVRNLAVSEYSSYSYAEVIKELKLA